jgi:hypothetical protein
MPQASAQNENTQHPDASRPERHESPGSPARPSYSPVTPTMSQAGLAFPQTQQTEQPRNPWMTEPPASSVNLDDNSDAIAMRAAISILQMQRQQSLKDMRTLEKMKLAAVDEPEQFINDLQAGKLTQQPRTGIDVDDDSDSDGNDEEPQVSDSKFGKFPAPQNVVRAPPIEWSKYHIVGEPLDRLHEIQRKYPGFKEEMLDAVQKPQPHTIASPYKPFADKLDDNCTQREG